MATVSRENADVYLDDLDLASIDLLELLPDELPQLGDALTELPFDAWCDRCEPEGGLTLDELVDLVAAEVAARGGSGALWLAAKIRSIAETARTLHATTPADYDARLEVLGWDEDLAAWQTGYDHGFWHGSN